MKKLLFKCVLLLVLTGGILYAGGRLYYHTDAYKSAMADTVKFRDMPENIDVAVFGNSHAGGAFQYAPRGKTLFSDDREHMLAEGAVIFDSQFYEDCHNLGLLE